MALTDIRNFLAIDGRVATAGQPTEAHLHEVAQAGFEAIVNLGLLDPKYCLRNEAESAAQLRLRYRHIPVRFDAPMRSDFDAFVACMDDWKNLRVFIHCAANYRVSSFVALYGELRWGWSRDVATKHMRRVWEPNETWCSFISDVRAEGFFPDR